MTKPTVLFLGDLNKDLKEYQEFKSKFECIDYEITSKEQLISDLETKFKNLEAIYGAWMGFIPVGGFKDDIVDHVPESLKVISICSVGYDSYDYKKMAEKGIILTNVPATSAAVPVADMVLLNALLAFRNLYLNQQAFLQIPHTLKSRSHIQAGGFNFKTGQLEFKESNKFSYGENTGQLQNVNPKGHDVVVVGFGQIGKLIGSRLAGIGMNVHYIKRTPLTAEEEASLGYKATFQKSLKDVTAFADLVVLAAPGTPETYHMLNEDIINSFEKPFRVINVGRGSIIDENALVNGLEQGKILFAGLDVFENEPIVHPGLLNRQNVFLTPHIGASTVENFDTTAIQALKNIQNVLSEGGEGLNRVN